MGEDEEKLVEAVERLRRDSHPWRYIFFTFINGIAQGLGIALGMTLIVGVVVYFLTKVLTRMIDFPIIGEYVRELMKILDAYIKQGVKVR